MVQPLTGPSSNGCWPAKLRASDTLGCTSSRPEGAGDGSRDAGGTRASRARPPPPDLPQFLPSSIADNEVFRGGVASAGLTASDYLSRLKTSAGTMGESLRKSMIAAPSAGIAAQGIRDAPCGGEECAEATAGSHLPRRLGKRGAGTPSAARRCNSKPTGRSIAGGMSDA